MKGKRMALFLVTTMLVASPVYPISAFAEGEKLLTGAGNRDVYGANYWQTSNLREWANSEEKMVGYTNLPPSSAYASPSYEKESGFLSEFSDVETAAIAVTQHRVYLSSDDASMVGDGGSQQIDSNEYRGESVRFNLPSSDFYSDRFYQKVNDKVFLLNSYQLQKFVEKRNLPLLRNLTPEAKLKHNRTSDTMSWWINAPSSNIGNDQNQYVSTNKLDIIGTSQPRSAMGFVPALHLKPNTAVSGKEARKLSIGEVVTFGRYLGSPIQWRVVNRSSSGAPLLLSERVLDIKSYDGTGDKTAVSQSRYTHFSSFDIPMSESDNYTPFDNTSDTEEPVFNVLNEGELYSRSNASFTLDLEATDAGSGLDTVELPNGIFIGTNRFSYTVSENREYVFKAKDRVGNLKVFTVPVSNINPESSVSIAASADGWTNKDVTVDITANNQVGFANRTFQFNSRDYTPYVYPNFTSYTGKRIRMTGSYELVDATAPLGSVATGTGFYYRSSVKRGNDYFLNNKWMQPVRSTLSELEEKGKQSFDLTYTIPGDYFENLQAWTQITVNSNIRDYTVKYSDVSYELLDMDDFGIEKIILPNGQEVFKDTYRDVLTKDGSYKYRVLDNRGKTTEKTITVKIDKGLPVLNHTLRNGKWTGNEDWIDIEATDTLSGVKELVLPNGQIHKGNTFAYRVTQNGNYTFTAIDNAGNRYSKTVTVTNFDEKVPTAKFVSSQTGWTNQNVTITIQAEDKESGLSYIELPNKTRVASNTSTYTVTQNGRYTFRVVDKTGNAEDYVFEVSQIDKELPYVFIIGEKRDATTWNINLKVEDR